MDGHRAERHGAPLMIEGKAIMDWKPGTIDLSQYRLVQAPARRSAPGVRAPSSFADRFGGVDVDGEILAWIRSHVSDRNNGKLH
jgi:hypothetical protein